MPSSAILAGPCYGLPSPIVETCKKTLLLSSSSSKSSHPQWRCPYDGIHYYIHSHYQLSSRFSKHNPLGGPRASIIVNHVASPFCTILSTSSTFRRWDDVPSGAHVWRALRDNNPPGSLQESEDNDPLSLGEEEDGDYSPSTSSTARSLVGNYAASTALAVKESLPPEGVIVLLACLVGLLTGGSVVLFNIGVT